MIEKLSKYDATKETIRQQLMYLMMYFHYCLKQKY